MTNKSILIVEDEIALAKALRLKLTSSGFDVSVANNGKEAEEYLVKQKFDLIMVDLLMPDVDGWEVLKSCQSQNLSAVVVSNLGQEEDVVKAKNLGAKDFIVKSETSLSEIVERVKKVI